MRVCPPRFPATVIAPTVRPATSLYAVTKSSWAWVAEGSSKCMVPFTVGDPVRVVPGLNPRSPLTVVAPVLLTVEPDRTPKVVADPRSTGDGERSLVTTFNTAVELVTAPSGLLTRTE